MSITELKNRLFKQAQRLENVYGLGMSYYYVMLRSQKYCCAICGTPFGFQVPYTDHDHATMEVRGLLCPNCNTGLGMFKDSGENLLRAAAYLQKNHRQHLIEESKKHSFLPDITKFEV